MSEPTYHSKWRVKVPKGVDIRPIVDDLLPAPARVTYRPTGEHIWIDGVYWGEVYEVKEVPDTNEKDPE